MDGSGVAVAPPGVWVGGTAVGVSLGSGVAVLPPGVWVGSGVFVDVGVFDRAVELGMPVASAVLVEVAVEGG